MNVVLQRPMTLESFLVWEDKQPLRYEFDGYRPVAMTGGTAAHAAIQRNLLIALGTRLRGKPCQAFGSELKIQVAGRIRYPDAFVVCSPLAANDKIVSKPVVNFEILSDSTKNSDLITKNVEYRPTLRAALCDPATIQPRRHGIQTQGRGVGIRCAHHPGCHAELAGDRLQHSARGMLHRSAPRRPRRKQPGLKAFPLARQVLGFPPCLTTPARRST
jgi:Uma2 family endonuclease